jgi:hypothetical protein
LHFPKFKKGNKSALTKTDEDLRAGRGARGPLDAPDAAVEDARDAVGLGDDGAVANGEADAQSDAQNGARDLRRLGQDDERHQVAGEDAGQQHVAQLAARRHDDRRLVVPDEHQKHEQGAQDADHGERQRHQRPRAVPLDHLEEANTRTNKNQGIVAWETREICWWFNF